MVEGILLMITGGVFRDIEAFFFYISIAALVSFVFTIVAILIKILNEKKTKSINIFSSILIILFYCLPIIIVLFRLLLESKNAINTLFLFMLAVIACFIPVLFFTNSGAIRNSLLKLLTLIAFLTSLSWFYLIQFS